MIVSGQGLSIRSAKLEGAVVQCIRDWATAFPQELTQFDQEMKQRRRENAYRGNDMALFIETPVRLDSLFRRRIDPDYRHDHEVMNLIAAHFPIGMVRRNDRL